MKKIAFSLILIMNVFILTAQRNYLFHDISEYRSDTLCFETYTYVADTLGYEVCLYNIENHPGRGEIEYKDGSSWPSENPWELPDFVAINDALAEHMHSIVDNAFSKEQAETLEGQKFVIVLNISSSNGSVTDVYFKFPSFFNFTQIPVEVYREIETQLKSIIFEVTDEGRKLFYCYLSWSQCPWGREDTTHNPNLPLPDGSEGGGSEDSGSSGDNNVHTGPAGSIVVKPMVPAK